MIDVLLVAPVVPGVSTGNVVTAARWAKILRGLGAKVRVREALDEEPWDLLVALHARRSAPSIRAARERFPDAPIFVGLGGTELRPAEAGLPEVLASLDAADRIVALQARALDVLRPEHRAKACVVVQSADLPEGLDGPPEEGCDVAVVAHLRDVKDPLRTALAARELPADSRIRVRHVGAVLEPRWERAARDEERENPRYRWLGGLPREEALAVLASSHVHVLASRSEGGANAISEALALGVPTIASHIPGSIGLLGEGWPAYFPVGDTRALAELLSRFETETAFRSALHERTRRLAERVRPEREREAWRALLDDLA